VGFTNGKKKRGYQYCLPRNAHTHLRHSVKVFRISDALTTARTISVAQEESFHELADVLKNAQGAEYNIAETSESVKKNDEEVSNDEASVSEDAALSMQDEDEDEDPASMNAAVDMEDDGDLEDAEDDDGGVLQGEKNVAI